MLYSKLSGNLAGENFHGRATTCSTAPLADILKSQLTTSFTVRHDHRAVF